MFLMLGLMFSNITVSPAQNSSMPELVQDFTLTDSQGNNVTLSDYRGKVVMINFWATWCPPCVEELPTMKRLKANFSDKPFEILAINMGEDITDIIKFVERTKFDLNFPLLVDPITSVADAYKVKGLPATLFVDKQGRFAFGGVGSRDWNSEASRNQITPLFDS